MNENRFSKAMKEAFDEKYQGRINAIADQVKNISDKLGLQSALDERASLTDCQKTKLDNSYQIPGKPNMLSGLATQKQLDEWAKENKTAINRHYEKNKKDTDAAANALDKRDMSDRFQMALRRDYINGMLLDIIENYDIPEKLVEASLYYIESILLREYIKKAGQTDRHKSAGVKKLGKTTLSDEEIKKEYAKNSKSPSPIAKTAKVLGYSKKKIYATVKPRSLKKKTA